MLRPSWTPSLQLRPPSWSSSLKHSWLRSLIERKITQEFYQTVQYFFPVLCSFCLDLFNPTVAPVIMTPKMLNSATTMPSRARVSVGTAGVSQARMDFATLGRAPFKFGIGARRICSRDLQIVEATEELLDADIPEPEGVASDVSLLRGFNATIPSAEKSRSRRRQMRNVETPRLGLKKMGMTARGLLAEAEREEHEQQSVVSEEDMVLVAREELGNKKGKGKRKGRERLGAGKVFGNDELTRQAKEIRRDKENLHIRRVRDLHLHDNLL